MADEPIEVMHDEVQRVTKNAQREGMTRILRDVTLCAVSFIMALSLYTIQHNQKRASCIRNYQAQYLLDFSKVLTIEISDREPSVQRLQQDAIAYQNAGHTCK